MLSNGSLRLESARAEHSGKYRCKADNGVAPALSKSLTIHVNGMLLLLTFRLNFTFQFIVKISAKRYVKREMSFPFVFRTGEI